MSNFIQISKSDKYKYLKVDDEYSLSYIINNIIKYLDWDEYDKAIDECESLIDGIKEVKEYIEEDNQDEGDIDIDIHDFLPNNAFNVFKRRIK